MSKILAILRHDINHVRGNAIALLVIMGLAIMPSFYGWFNIAGGWDPYGNTGQLQFRVFVDFNNNGKAGKDVYFDDFEFLE